MVILYFKSVHRYCIIISVIATSATRSSEYIQIYHTIQLANIKVVRSLPMSPTLTHPCDVFKISHLNDTSMMNYIRLLHTCGLVQKTIA